MEPGAAIVAARPEDAAPETGRARLAPFCAAASLPEGRVAEATVGEVAVEIRRMTFTALLDLAAAVGETIFTRFYGGDVAAWRSHGPKAASLRKLSNLLGEDQRFSAARLYECVGIHLLRRRWGEHPAFGRLTASHVGVVLGLPEPAQDRLLREAVEQGWSVRDLRRIARPYRVAPTGRPPVPPILRAVRRIAKLSADVAALAEHEAFLGVSREDRWAAQAVLIETHERLERVQRALSPKRASPGAS